MQLPKQPEHEPDLALRMPKEKAWERSYMLAMRQEKKSQGDDSKKKRKRQQQSRKRNR